FLGLWVVTHWRSFQVDKAPHTGTGVCGTSLTRLVSVLGVTPGQCVLTVYRKGHLGDGPSCRIKHVLLTHLNACLGFFHRDIPGHSVMNQGTEPPVQI